MGLWGSLTAFSGGWQGLRWHTGRGGGISSLLLLPGSHCTGIGGHISSLLLLPGNHGAWGQHFFLTASW